MNKSVRRLFWIVMMVISSCGHHKVVSEKPLDSYVDKLAVENHPFDSLYNACSLLKYPPHQNYYHVNSSSEFREFQMSEDSVIFVRAGNDNIGTRSKLRESFLYWEDINQCYNLAFFDNKPSVGNRSHQLHDSLDFTRFTQLRYLRSTSSISRKHLNQVLLAASRLKGLEVNIDFDLPDEICNCDSLEYLQLISNYSIKLPSCLKSLTNLKYIQLIGFYDDIIWQIPSLKALELQLPSSIGLAIPDSLEKLKELRQLSIYGCKSLILPESFNQLDSLELLELEWINDTISIADELNGLENLKGVRLVQLNLHEFPKFKGSSKLKLLKASSINFLTNSEVDISNCSASLEALILGGVGFSNNSMFPKGIEYAGQLVFLHLIGFPIENIPLELIQLKKLKSLMLYGNNLTFEGLVTIYDKLHKQGLLYYNPPYIRNLTDEQREEIWRLDRTSRGALSSFNKPAFITYGNAFDYYQRKIKYGIETEWSNTINYD
jgi:hypothetical protein